MKQSIQLRLGQHLTMTPQLQQAIRLLQLSSTELQLEVQQALDSNLMLEVDEERGDELAEQLTAGDQPPERANSQDGDLDLQGNELPDELPVDSAWEDVYEYSAAPSSGAAAEQDGPDFELAAGPSESLRDHLLWQIRLMPLSDVDQVIAEALIDAIDADGYLADSPEEIHETLRKELDIDLDEVEAVLHQIQNCDPPGVGARDLRESLVLQLRQDGLPGEWLAAARELVERHFGLLAARDFNQLKRRMKLDDDSLAQVLKLIQSLNPRPGAHISDEEPQYIVPDVIVRKVKGTWKVELNTEAAPRLRVNPYYASVIKDVSDSGQSSYLKGQLQEARWFIKSLQSRNETLLKVASCIVERQRGFLQHGEEAMKALVLHDVAEAVGMHESTISRVTTKKYMHTPRGMFELKYFFSSHVTTATGGECSATAIRALIKKLIAAENPRKPLSDSKIVGILEEQGINVARRTVAKYRESMAIAPSNERKRLA